MADCTYTVPDLTASGDALYGPRICHQPFINWAWPAHGFNHGWWQDGWGYDDVLPYFKRSETYHGPRSAYHGEDGPLSIIEYLAETRYATGFLPDDPEGRQRVRALAHAIAMDPEKPAYTPEGLRQVLDAVQQPPAEDAVGARRHVTESRGHHSARPVRGGRRGPHHLLGYP